MEEVREKILRLIQRYDIEMPFSEDSVRNQLHLADQIMQLIQEERRKAKAMIVNKGLVKIYRKKLAEQEEMIKQLRDDNFEMHSQLQTTEKGKSFFDLPESEKREIVDKAAEDSNKAQKEVLEKGNK